jgi:hypothetical protein
MANGVACINAILGAFKRGGPVRLGFLRAQDPGISWSMAWDDYFIPKTDREINYLLYMFFEALLQSWARVHPEKMHAMS